MTGQKKISLGLSNYKKIRTEGHYYADKTLYIEVLENLNTKYPTLLRPCGFGKTLFADMLRTYYDVKEKDNFEKLFGDTYIGEHKTELANSYYVLYLNFSELSPTPDLATLEASFGANINSHIETFIEYYEITDIMLDKDENYVSYINRFFNLLRGRISNKLFLIIDEFNHFASASPSRLDGFVRSFYEVLKKHTTSIIDRIFITGVTSLTLDSLTSGFNICKNVSNLDSLNHALGFTSEEVTQMLDYLDVPNRDETLAILKENYNGYSFSRSVKQAVYNSNMILYYLDEYITSGDNSFELTDPNITGDYSKLSSMFDLYSDDVKKESVLQKLMGNETITGRLVTSFNLSTRFTYDHFVSLLYYLGLLTIDSGLVDGSFQFRAPNRVIRHIYYDYYFQYLESTLRITESTVSSALIALEDDQNISPLSELVEKIINDSTEHNNRYLIHFRENTLQTLFYLILRKSNEYQAIMEYPLGKKFIDILHRPKTGQGSTFALELKYLTPAKYEAEPILLEEKIKDIHEQLDSTTNSFTNAEATGIGIVFVGKECRYQDTIFLTKV